MPVGRMVSTQLFERVLPSRDSGSQLWIPLLPLETGALSDDRICRLEGIGFKWWGRGRGLLSSSMSTQPSPPPCVAAAIPTWEDSFEELSRYHSTHGHCNLSQLEGRLGRWVANQRTAFHPRKEGKVGEPRMSDDRIQRL